ncbi:PrsW family glutamic-type intramembrane protease [Novosphingobium huizhouense]|uniref:PrsW family glutamic-type intramembrane protease n=1 Tax=Novosphingobium huizhouense TaxID=2866625 RepID=UPI001CD914C9|nr:PrsW family glutamic-type intramembrane protease [Novosphingobium huizhouense]
MLADHLDHTPLATARGKLMLAGLLAAQGALATWAWNGWVHPVSNAPLLVLGIGAGLLGSSWTLIAIAFLGRRRRATWPVRWLVFLWAAAVTPACAAFFNSHSPATALTVGINEEFWKVTPLLLAAWFVPWSLRGTRDGLLMGALGGVGFNVIELAVYYIRMSYPQQGLFRGLDAQLGRLGLWGVDNHVVWSALVGAGIGHAIHTRSGRRWLIPLGTYLLAAVTHMAQDFLLGPVLLVLILAGIVQRTSGVSIVGTPTKAQVAMSERWLPTASGLEVIAINMVILPLLALALLRSGHEERKALAAALSGEDGTIVTPEELADANRATRFHRRMITASTARARKHIRRAQDALAFRKEFLARIGIDDRADPVATRYRARITALRSAP